ncbi:MAG TPA: glycosyltransferase family 4 protein [Burkholderiales bacterium]|nr:glycosyltransferase family 4 protein [Burkholderiales bacterium]
MSQRPSFYGLYATREKHPTYRVDLTELFSAGLTRKGHRIDWHMQAIDRSPTETVSLASGGKVFVGRAFGGASLWRKVFNQLAGLRHDFRLYRLAQREDYDFVQVRDKTFAALVGLLAARSRGIPFFYWMSFPYPEADRFRANDPEMNISLTLRSFYRLRGAWTAWLLYRVILPRASHVFVQSDRMKDDVARRGVVPEQMTAVPMGINLEQVGATNGEEATTPTLVYVGSLVRLRRIDFLLHMLKRVHEQVPEAELLLVGDGPARDMAFLKSETQRLGLTSKVRYTGFVPMSEAWTYIQHATVCLSPLRPNPILDAGTPTKVIEYMAFNRVVVANRHPDQSKLLEESGAGYAVEYESDAFAQAVIELLRDPESARRMGARGREYVRRHRSYAALTDALEARYLELLGREQSLPLAEATR